MLTQRRRPRRPKIVLVRFFLSLRFLAAIFDHFFGFRAYLGGLRGAQIDHFWHRNFMDFCVSLQERPKSSHGRPKSGQGRHKSGQEGPKSDQERPYSGPRAAKSGQKRPRAAQEWPRAAPAVGLVVEQRMSQVGGIGR